MNTILTPQILAERTIQRLKSVSSDISDYRKLISARLHKSNVLHETDGKTIYLNLHDGQMRTWQSEKRIIAMIAGSQGGKTSFGPWWLNREIERHGAGDYIAATASYDLFKLKMLPEIQNVFEHVLKTGRYWAGDKVLELADPQTGKFKAARSSDPMWGRIILRSAVASGGLESTTAKAAWLDEAGQDEFSLSAYEAVLRRLALNVGRLLLTTTLYNLGWLVQDVMNKADDERADTDVIQFESISNPAFPVAEFERMRDTMAPWKFDMFMRGLLRRPPGMIYGDFVDDYREAGGHKVKPFDPPIEWPRFVGVDPGAVNTAMVWLAHDVRHNIYYLYRESLEGNKSTPEHARGAAKLADSNKEHVIGWYVGQKAEVQQRIDWQAAGVLNVFRPSVHDVEAGIDRVIRLWREHRLYVFDTCRGTLDQIGRYSRKVNANGDPVDEIKDKATFHYLDALRYVAVGVTASAQIIKAEVKRYA